MFTLATNAINDVIAGIKLPDHLGNDVDVILQVCIDGDGHIGINISGFQSRHECILVPHIACQFQATHVAARIALNQLPRAVTRAVINIEDVAVITDDAIAHHAAK